MLSFGLWIVLVGWNEEEESCCSGCVVVCRDRSDLNGIVIRVCVEPRDSIWNGDGCDRLSLCEG